MGGSRFPRALLTDSAAARPLHEEGQLGLALTAEQLEVDLGAANAASVRVDDRLRPEALRGEHAADIRERRVAADALEVAAELLDRVDRPQALDLDGDPAVGVVAAHEVYRA